MKLLLDGKQRSIYFQKDNTAYYNSGGSKTDITHIFKKTGGGLKKKYSNLLIENDNNILNKNNRKLILGGMLEINPFADIVINNDDKLFYKKIHQIFLLAKIQYHLGILDSKNENFRDLLIDIAVSGYNLYNDYSTISKNENDKDKVLKTLIPLVSYEKISSKLDTKDTKFNSDLTLLNKHVKSFLKKSLKLKT